MLSFRIDHILAYNFTLPVEATIKTCQKKWFIHVEQVEHAKHTDVSYVLHVLHGQSKRGFQLPLLIIMSILGQKEILNNILVPNADHRTVIDLPLPEFRHRESRTRIVDVHTRIDEPHLSRCCVDEGVAARFEVIDHVLVVVGDLPRRRREIRAGIIVAYTNFSAPRSKNR